MLNLFSQLYVWYSEHRKLRNLLPLITQYALVYLLHVTNFVFSYGSKQLLLFKKDPFGHDIIRIPTLIFTKTERFLDLGKKTFPVLESLFAANAKVVTPA